MANKLDIYNAALVMSSTKTMATETEDSPQGRAVRALFPAQYEAVLGTDAWPFALERVSLTGAATDNTRVPEFVYEYTLPDDYVKAVGFGGDTDPLTKIIEGNSLYSDQPSPCILIYIANVDVSMARGPFIECLQLKLGTEMAYKFRHDEPLARRLQVQYQQCLNQARSAITEFVDLPGPTVGTTLVGPGGMMQ